MGFQKESVFFFFCMKPSQTVALARMTGFVPLVFLYKNRMNFSLMYNFYITPYTDLFKNKVYIRRWLMGETKEQHWGEIKYCTFHKNYINYKEFLFRLQIPNSTNLIGNPSEHTHVYVHTHCIHIYTHTNKAVCVYVS